MRLEEVSGFYAEAKGSLYACLEFERDRIQKVHAETLEDFRREIKELNDSVARADKEAKQQQLDKLLELRNRVRTRFSFC